MYNNKIDNMDLDVPFETSPREAKAFPHDFNRMEYNKDDHRYYLTEAGLSHYHIDFEPQRVQRLIRTATDHVYSYIALMAQTNYNLMCYRIAKSLLGRNKSRFEGRLEFEQLLAKQADFINDFGDAKRTPKMIVNSDTGRMRDQDVDMSSGYWLSDEVISWLNGRNLTDPNAIYNAYSVRWNEY